MERKSEEGISLFVRDERTGRFLLNAKALQALGINPVRHSNAGTLLGADFGAIGLCRSVEIDQLRTDVVADVQRPSRPVTQSRYGKLSRESFSV